MSESLFPKIYFVVNARLPNEKAHGIQIAKTCESFIKHGREVVLVVPKRKHIKKSIQEFYKLSTPVPVTYLSCIDIYSKGRICFWFSSVTFIVSYLVYFIAKIIKREKFIFYSVDMDTFSMTPLTLLPRPFFSELHGARNPNLVTKLFFKYSTGIIAINEAVKEIVISKFSQKIPVLVESNGVDIKMFDNEITIIESRKTLNLAIDIKIALFAGRFYSWKEVGILAQAANVAPGVYWYVIGGSENDFLKVSGLNNLPANLIICGDKQAADVPLWVASADVVLALGTKKNQGSWRFTSPMKVFEYMASCRPIVASRTPALESIFTENEVYFYEPDDANDLSVKVIDAIANQKPEAVRLARFKAETHTWDKRATRILGFIDNVLN